MSTRQERVVGAAIADYPHDPDKFNFDELTLTAKMIVRDRIDQLAFEQGLSPEAASLLKSNP